MVNNSNIIKMNNHFSPQTFEYKKRAQRKLCLETQILAWGRLEKYGMINRLMGFLASPLYNCISNDNTEVFCYILGIYKGS
jgi:hypothetical protein